MDRKERGKTKGMAESLYHRTGMNVRCSVPDVNLGSFHVSGDDCRSEVYSTRVEGLCWMLQDFIEVCSLTSRHSRVEE